MSVCCVAHRLDAVFCMEPSFWHFLLIKSSDVALFEAGENTGSNSQDLGALEAVEIFLIPLFLPGQASHDKSIFE